MRVFVLTVIAGAILAGTMPAASPLYNFKVDSIDNKPVTLGDYQGKVLLMVNVASQPVRLYPPIHRPRIAL